MLAGRRAREVCDPPSDSEALHQRSPLGGCDIEDLEQGPGEKNIQCLS